MSPRFVFRNSNSDFYIYRYDSFLDNQTNNYENDVEIFSISNFFYNTSVVVPLKRVNLGLKFQSNLSYNQLNQNIDIDPDDSEIEAEIISEYKT